MGPGFGLEKKMREIPEYKKERIYVPVVYSSPTATEHCHCFRVWTSEEVLTLRPLAHTWKVGTQATQLNRTSTCCCHAEVIRLWDHFSVPAIPTEAGNSGMFPCSPLLQSLLSTASGLQTVYVGFSLRTHSCCILGRKEVPYLHAIWCFHTYDRPQRHMIS